MIKEYLVLVFLILSVKLERVHHIVIKSSAGCGLKKYQEYKTFLDRCHPKYNS